MKYGMTVGKWVFLVCVLGIFAGCGSSSGYSSNSPSGGACTLASATPATSVTIQDFSFSPNCVKVAQNQAVTWINNGPTTHTVTSDPGAAESVTSGNLSQGQTFSHTFTATSGSGIGYHCSIHPSMTATVWVQ